MMCIGLVCGWYGMWLVWYVVGLVCGWFGMWLVWHVGIVLFRNDAWVWCVDSTVGHIVDMSMGMDWYVQ
jgi:hypothetical protein